MEHRSREDEPVPKSAGLHIGTRIPKGRGLSSHLYRHSGTNKGSQVSIRLMMPAAPTSGVSYTCGGLSL